MVRFGKLTNQELMDSYGSGLPAERWFGPEWSSFRNEPKWEGTREGARFAYPPLREGYDPKPLSSYDWFNKEYVKEYPVWQQGAFTNISPPSRNAGFSFPTSPKSYVEVPRGTTPSGPIPGEKFTDLTPLQEAVSNEIISRGHNPQHIYDIYTSTTKVDAAGQPVFPLERVHSQRQQDLAGRIINESIASARETRPELFTEPAARGEAILPSQSASNEILPDLGPRDPGAYKDLNINNYVSYGKAKDRPGGHQDVFDFSAGPPPPEAPQRLQQEVSGEQAAAVPIDPADLVGGSFFSGPNQTGGPAIGSGYHYKHNVHSSPRTFGALSEIGRRAGENAPFSEFIAPVGRFAAGALHPAVGAFGLFGDILNSMGAYHQFNPATDSNLFADPETGLSTWGSISPGGGGSQRGTLNLLNQLQDFGGSYPNRQVQTPSRTIYHEDGSSTVVPQYANARDLAYIMDRGERAPGLYTQQTPVGYQDFGEGHNVTNQEALNTYNLTGAGALLNEAGAILGPDAGYNETRDLADAMAEAVQDDMSNQPGGDYLGGWF